MLRSYVARAFTKKAAHRGRLPARHRINGNQQRG